MSKLSKRLLLLGTIAFLAIGAGTIELYREIRPSVKQWHFATIQNASLDVPDIVRQIPFDGPVDYVQFHGYSARPPCHLLASHISMKQLEAFCSLHGLQISGGSFPIPEVPPSSWSIVDEFKLDPKVFAFRSNEREIVKVIGNTSGTRAWLVQADYCPTSNLIVMELRPLAEK